MPAVVKVTSRNIVSRFDQYNNVVTGLATYVGNAGRETAHTLMGELEGELRAYPRGASFPYGEFPWTSEKQRRYVIAFKLPRDANGKVMKYQRTGALAKSWIVETKQQRNRFVITVKNTSDIAKYVYGNMNIKDLRTVRRPQQRFHAITGWPLAAKIVKDWFDIIDKSFRDNIKKEIKKAIIENVRTVSR